MTHEERGRLGGSKRGEKLRALYALSPKLCKVCSQPIPFEKRRKTGFCSNACSLKMRTINNPHPKEKLREWATLGGKTAKERKERNVEEYNKNPKLCLWCNNPISYEKRKYDTCNHKCAGNYISSQYSGCTDPTTYEGNCKYCGKLLRRENVIRKGTNVFCSQSHQALYYTLQKLINKEPIKSTTLRYYILHTREYKCEGKDCGLATWHGKPIPLDLHHEDGDVTNNEMENLKLLCKNCHALTDNYGCKNYGKSTRQVYYVRKIG